MKRQDRNTIEAYELSCSHRDQWDQRPSFTGHSGGAASVQLVSHQSQGALKRGIAYRPTKRLRDQLQERGEVVSGYDLRQWWRYRPDPPSCIKAGVVPLAAPQWPLR
ncbi:hypothetical protein EYF80_012767 [Liparis tanakae]|uniref:Uncharacterized protein n=1 Tax=Liparis tanakae TaxID=230148 RepID=A0A4Z2IGS6_9TELE|nr:hypothetical protein EYF80_012767 [Liparis tanakae]